MKQLTFFTTLFLLSIYSQSIAQTFFEGFEQETFPPQGWTIFDNGVGLQKTWEALKPTTEQAVIGENSGVRAALCNQEDVSSGTAEDWLVSPLITLPSTGGNNNNILTYDVRNYIQNDQGSSLTIRVSTTSPSSPAAFTTVETVTETMVSNSVYTQRSVNLSSYANQSIYIAFVMSNDNGDPWFIDNVKIGNTACTLPTGFDQNLYAEAISETQGYLSWDSINLAGQPWELRYLPFNEPLNSSSAITKSLSNPSSISGYYIDTVTNLKPATTYQAYIRSTCSGGDKSQWYGPLTFKTTCSTSGFLTPPYHEPFAIFNSSPGDVGACWVEASDGSGVNFPNNVTPLNRFWTASTGYNAAVLSAPGTTSDWLISPRIDLGNGTKNYKLSFALFDAFRQATVPSGNNIYIVVSTSTGVSPIIFNSSDIIKSWGTGSSITTDTVSISLAGYTGIRQIGIYCISNTNAYWVLNQFKIEEDVMTGTKKIAQLSNNSSLELYPNPTTGNTTIKLSESLNQEAQVEIFNVVGQQVLTQSIRPSQDLIDLPTEQLDNGIYFVKLSTHNKIYSTQLIKQ